MSATSSLRYDPFSDAHRDDPWTLYARLRDEAPLYHATATDAWVLSRYEDVAAAIADTERFSSDAMNGIFLGRPTGDGKERLPRETAQGSLVAVDPPAHSELRRIVNRGFTPKTIRSWHERIEELVTECLADAHEGEPFDVVGRLAGPLPVAVIAELLGAEPSKRAEFRAWADAATQLTSGSRRGDTQGIEAGTAAILDLATYLFGKIQERMTAPRDDLLSVLVAAQHDEALSPEEAIGFAALLLFAGSETTTHLIGNAARVLLDHPAELARALADPGRIPAILEETLRWDGPVHYVFRRATEDVTLHGGTIPRNANVALLLAAANRDPRRFQDAEQFRPGRSEDGHLGFGYGTHFCLGAALARAEAEIALRRLVPLLQRGERLPARVEYVDSFQIRGLRHLEIVPRAATTAT